MFGSVRTFIVSVTKPKANSRCGVGKMHSCRLGCPIVVSRSVRALVEDKTFELKICCGMGKCILVVWDASYGVFGSVRTFGAGKEFEANLCCVLGGRHSGRLGCPISGVWICPGVG